MNTEKINDLSFYNDQGTLIINAKQFDTGRLFSFNIIDNDEPFDLSNCRVYLRILKADGTQFQGEECCSISKSLITIDTSVSNGNQILTCTGKNQCELHLTDENGKSLTTWTFIINVAPRIHDGSIVGGEKLSIILGKIKKCISDIKPVAFSGSYNDLLNKPTMTSLNGRRITTLTNISQINEIGFWSIYTIDSSYATQIGIDENIGDFHAVCCNYNGDGTTFNFGCVLLFSPRLGSKYYYIQIWQGVARAIKSILKSNLLNTIEQISANTSADNVCSALALKAAISDYTNKFNQINSDLSSAKSIRLVTQYISTLSTDETGNIYYDFVTSEDLPQYASPIVQNSYNNNQVIGTKNVDKNTIRIYFSCNVAPLTVSILYKIKL